MKRDSNIDILKAIAIIAVIVGHFYVFILNSDVVDNTFFFEICCSFHLPLFFFLSGFFFKKNNDVIKLVKYIINRFKRLIIPYFLWGSLCALLLYYQGWRVGLVFHGYWFLKSLFLYSVIIALFSFFSNAKTEIIITLISIVLFYIAYKLKICSRPDYYAFFALGFLLRNKSLQQGNAVFIIMVFIVYIFLLLEKGISNQNYITYFIEILAVYSLIQIVYKINKRVKVLEWIGKSSLEIYVLHYLILFGLNWEWLRNIYPKTWNTLISDIFIIIPISFCISGLSVVASKIIHKQIPLLFGEVPNLSLKSFSLIKKRRKNSNK